MVTDTGMIPKQQEIIFSMDYFKGDRDMRVFFDLIDHPFFRFLDLQ